MKKQKFVVPDIRQSEIDEVIDTLKSGWITTGPKTKQLERDIAEFCSVSRAVCLNSATAAAELTLRILGVGPGDEVITSAYTYTASASVIAHCGAKVVLVDTYPDSPYMDLEKVADAITEHTKAIICVDFAGTMCDYEGLFAVARSKRDIFVAESKYQEIFNRVVVVADAAHSLGGVYKGQASGSIADFSSFSFHAVKNLTTAEGGAATWRDREGLDNEAVYREFMLLSLHGQTKDALSKTIAGGWEYDIMFPGYKCNMTDIHASLGLAQLRRYPDMLNSRRELIEYYDDALANNPNFSVLNHYDKDTTSSGHLYILRLQGKDEAFRNELIIRLAEEGVECNVHYKPLPMLTAYKNMGYTIEDFPNAFNYYQNEITLPLYVGLTYEDLDFVITTLNTEYRLLDESK